MKAQTLFWILTPVLTATFLWQVSEARSRWHVSRVLKTVETVTLQASRRGKMPRQLADLHLRLLREAAERQPALIDIPVARSWQYLLLGRPQAAVRTLEEALALEPRARVYANLGEAYLKADRPRDAAEAFDRALVLDPRLRGEIEPQLKRARRSAHEGNP